MVPVGEAQAVSPVMPGLEPDIDAATLATSGVDGRDKPGHDEREF